MLRFLLLQAIQDTLLPPPVHIFRKKKTKASQKLNTNGNGAVQQTDSNNESALSSDIPAVGTQETENGHLERSVESNPEMKMGSVTSSSPYPNVCYPLPLLFCCCCDPSCLSSACSTV